MPIDSDSTSAAFEEFKASLASGEDVDPEDFCSTHVECGPELRREIDRFLAEKKSQPDPHGSPTPESDPADSKTIPLAKSTQTLGDFRLLREIGRGGMGVVYEAEQISLKRRVALKVLASPLSPSPDQRAKFQGEAEAGGRQRHPGIVAVHAVGEQDGILYIAQELIEGGWTLSDRLGEARDGDELPKGYFHETVTLFVKVAEALGHAHANGVIHRDVKPSNILLTREGSPKISDFGLAKVESAMELTRTGEFEGTPSYVSPEQIARPAGGIDHRTDIYSLGIALYEALTLARPFRGETSLEVLKQVLGHEPSDPRKVNPRVPRDLAVITLKAIEKEPVRRYATMSDFAADLRRWLNGEAILARPTGPVTRSFKWVKRHRSLMTAVLAVSAVVLCFGVFTVVRHIQRDGDFHRLLAQAEELSCRQEWDAALDRVVAALGLKPDDEAARERHRLYLQQRELSAVKGERDEKVAALQRSDGMRLATESGQLLDRNP